MNYAIITVADQIKGVTSFLNISIYCNIYYSNTRNTAYENIIKFYTLQYIVT